MLMGSIHPDSRLAPHYPQHSLIVHRVQQMCRRVRLASPIIFHLAVRKLFIDLLRMHHSLFAHKIQQRLRLLPSRLRPRQTVLGRYAAIRARMHQLTNLSRDESVVDEEIFLYTKLCISSFQVSGAVIVDSMTQHQVLCPGRRANWIGLYKPHPMQSALQRRGTKQALRNGEPPQVIESDTHGGILLDLQDGNRPRTAARAVEAVEILRLRGCFADREAFTSLRMTVLGVLQHHRFFPPVPRHRDIPLRLRLARKYPDGVVRLRYDVPKKS